MTPTEYKEIVNQTAVYPAEVQDFGKAYVILGFLGEAFEASEEKHPERKFKEVFDTVWYFAAICKEFKLDFERLWEKLENAKEIEDKDMPNIFEALKKYYRDGKQIDKNLVLKFVMPIMFSLLKEYSPQQKSVGLQMNYDKLMLRRETNTLHGDGSEREIKK
jgi:hypothetical protein